MFGQLQSSGYVTVTEKPEASPPAAVARCELCGGPMPSPGEEVFRYHGFTGPCPPKKD